ncbi:hypothetical protein BU14_0614s0008 [Porphyra umbilicalis]|uniref:Uncharacterized protein n=1 Tax=Porphyra umbilicalis TaxID=2786 RepID=A0A1X6NRL1_PORUM|nr:hypothetical protein BU14_0614s0008 [Porphyra umbilicalis]OSX71034.1 hypothetical protein BU14_0614s0008 [Porphyra umbilicalis]|eukprot:OSX71033.1 hypothetical protein BU14_0614s0008 [Porphyra umbilicalis]
MVIVAAAIAVGGGGHAPPLARAAEVVWPRNAADHGAAAEAPVEHPPLAAHAAAPPAAAPPVVGHQRRALWVVVGRCRRVAAGKDAVDGGEEDAREAPLHQQRHPPAGRQRRRERRRRRRGGGGGFRFRLGRRRRRRLHVPPQPRRQVDIRREGDARQVDSGDAEVGHRRHQRRVGERRRRRAGGEDEHLNRQPRNRQEAEANHGRRARGRLVGKTAKAELLGPRLGVGLGGERDARRAHGGKHGDGNDHVEGDGRNRGAADERRELPDARQPKHRQGARKGHKAERHARGGGQHALDQKDKHDGRHFGRVEAGALELGAGPQQQPVRVGGGEEVKGHRRRVHSVGEDAQQPSRGEGREERRCRRPRRHQQRPQGRHRVRHGSEFGNRRHRRRRRQVARQRRERHGARAQEARADQHRRPHLLLGALRAGDRREGEEEERGDAHARHIDADGGRVGEKRRRQRGRHVRRRRASGAVRPRHRRAPRGGEGVDEAREERHVQGANAHIDLPRGHDFEAQLGRIVVKAPRRGHHARVAGEGAPVAARGEKALPGLPIAAAAPRRGGAGRRVAILLRVRAEKGADAGEVRPQPGKALLQRRGEGGGPVRRRADAGREARQVAAAVGAAAAVDGARREAAVPIPAAAAAAAAGRARPTEGRPRRRRPVATTAVDPCVVTPVVPAAAARVLAAPPRAAVAANGHGRGGNMAGAAAPRRPRRRRRGGRRPVPRLQRRPRVHAPRAGGCPRGPARRRRCRHRRRQGTGTRRHGCRYASASPPTPDASSPLPAGCPPPQVLPRQAASGGARPAVAVRTGRSGPDADPAPTPAVNACLATPPVGGGRGARGKPPTEPGHGGRGAAGGGRPDPPDQEDPFRSSFGRMRLVL